MLDKLNVFIKRYEELNQSLYDNTLVNDAQKYKNVMKELSSLEPIVSEYEKYKNTLEAIESTRQLLNDPDCDKELYEEATREISELKTLLEETKQNINFLLLPKDKNDERNVIIEIRAGAGGEEAALFSYVLYRMYCMYAEKKGFKSELLNINETELGGIKEVSFMINGENAYSRLKYESGVHRVQRVPETESGGRIHTSTVTVAVLPEADDVEISIDPKDLQIDTFRSSGAGGQHINKTESAIRITHIPTGLVVECQDERSQYKNKDKAMKVLKSRLLKDKQDKQAQDIADERKSQVGTGDRSEKIRTYNFPQGRVTDHRINLTLYKLDKIMDGDIQEIIDACIAADQAAKLLKMNEE